MGKNKWPGLTVRFQYENKVLPLYNGKSGFRSLAWAGFFYACGFAAFTVVNWFGLKRCPVPVFATHIQPHTRYSIAIPYNYYTLGI